jgi:hypothetical protein
MAAALEWWSSELLLVVSELVKVYSLVGEELARRTR